MHKLPGDFDMPVCICRLRWWLNFLKQASSYRHSRNLRVHEDLPRSRQIKQIVLLPVEMGLFHRLMSNAFWWPMRGPLRGSGKVYCSSNKRLPPTSQCLIHSQVSQVRPAVEEVQPCLHQAQKKGQDPEMLCHCFIQCQSLVQFSLSPSG